MSSVCDPSGRISSYDLNVVIDPCNAGTSIGTFDKPTTATDCLCRSGFKPKSTTWTFTTADIPELAQPTPKGELNFYMEDGAGYAAFVQGALVKVNNKIYPQIYQRNGNLTSLTIPTTLLADSVTYTVSPAVYGYWTFRGV